MPLNNGVAWRDRARMAGAAVAFRARLALSLSSPVRSMVSTCITSGMRRVRVEEAASRELPPLVEAGVIGPAFDSVSQSVSQSVGRSISQPVS